MENKGKKIKLSGKVWAYLGLFAVVLIWGLTPIVSDCKWVSGAYSPGMIVALRGLIAAIAIALINIKKLKNINRAYFKVALTSGVFLTAGYIAQTASYLYTTPAKSSFLENVNIIVVPIIMYFCTREKPTWSKVTACVVCFVGMGVLALREGAEGLLSIGLGDGLAILAGVFYGVNVALTGLYSKEMDTSLFVLIQLSLLSLISFIYAFAVEGAALHTLAVSFEWQSVVCMLGLGLLATALCWVLRTRCFKHIPVVAVAVGVSLASVVTGVCSVALGVDEPTWNLFVGGVVIIGSILFAELGDSFWKKKGKEEENGRA